jgi:hypothetical protein
LPGGVLGGKTGTAAYRDAEISLVQIEQMASGFQVGSDPLEDSLFFARVGDRDFDSAIQAKCAVKYLLQQFHRTVEHEVIAQQGAAETSAGQLDPLGRGNLPIASEHGDFAHLHKIHPHRVVDGAFVIGFDFIQGAEIVEDFNFVVDHAFEGIVAGHSRRTRFGSTVGRSIETILGGGS